MSCLEKTQKLGRSRQRRGATNESPAPASVAQGLSGAPPHPDAHGLPPPIQEVEFLIFFPSPAPLFGYFLPLLFVTPSHATLSDGGGENIRSGATINYLLLWLFCSYYAAESRK